MGDSFIVQFIKKWKQVGAISPSSIFLVEDMLDEVDFQTAKIIVELGAGSGSFTKEILKKMRKDAVLYVFEIDEVFYRRLSKIRDERMILIKDSAENVSKYVNRNSDYIISGIPLSNLNDRVKEGIISGAVENLRFGGIFLQFQYLPESLSLLRTFFGSVKMRFTFLNTPPAFFYICRKV